MLRDTRTLSGTSGSSGSSGIAERPDQAVQQEI